MRRLRWLVPPTIIGIIIIVGAAYLQQKDFLAQNAPAKPAPLASGISSTSNDFCFAQSSGDKPRVEICAASTRQLDNPPVTELLGVRLKLYHDNATEYDVVTSEKAQFDIAGKKLFSEGDVEITLGVPTNATPVGRLLKIHGSGVAFASETGQASTDKPVRFEFEQGGGSAVGAHYDPMTRELRLDSAVVLDWHGKHKDTAPMHIEAGQAWYFERESKVLLYPWAKLTRESLHMESAASEIILEDGAIKKASVPKASGVQSPPGRNKVEFAAAHLDLDFDDNMLIHSIQADRDASLTSTSPASTTKITGDRMDLAFAAAGKESVLTSAVATGRGEVRAEPLTRTATSADTRILRSEVIRMAMRTGGEEIDKVETDGPATLDFLPNRADQPKRNLRGDKIWIDYGIENHVKQFRSVNAFTRTERPPRPSVPAPPPMLTESKEIIGRFDASGELTALEQNNAFRYEEGERSAKSDRATLEQASGLITLFASAQALATSSDPTGSLTAERIVLNQKTGDTTAEGRVATTRQPSNKPQTATSSNAGVFSNKEKLQATAQKMTATNNAQRIRYEGSAVAWQGANRVEGDRIEIDQDRHVMEAHGKVMTQFVDSTPPADSGGKAKAKSGPSVFTVVRAPDLIYTESTRLALYQGGVHLERPGLTTDSRELRAFLKNPDADPTGAAGSGQSGTSLEKAFADGDAKLVSTTVNTATKQKRTRTGTAERAEYYVSDQQIVLTGGKPLLVDSVKGSTTGKTLTWWAENERLLVDGVEQQPTQTILKKK